MKGYKVKLKPNNKQKTLMIKFAGCARFTYNWAIIEQEKEYKNNKRFIDTYEMQKRFVVFKKNNQWLYEIPSKIQEQSIKDCCEAYKKFFKYKNNKPKLKKKKAYNQFFQKARNSAFNIYPDNKVKLSGIGLMKFFDKKYIPLDSQYYNIRINSYDNGNSWYLSLAVDEPQEIKEFKQDGIGIDLGLKDLATLNDGTKFENINKTTQIKKLEKRLKRTQRAISRKYEKNKDGKKYIKTQNILKQETKLKRQYQRLTNIREDYINKMISNIIKREPSFVVMENLNVSGMMKNRHLSKAISQCKFYAIRDKLQKKLANTTSQFILADRFYPSSKICNHCGNIKKDLKLKDRIYRCECGYTEDRDINASKNLYQYGLQKLAS